MTDLEADPSVKVVVFQSANPDFFIAHLDVAKAAERPEVLGLWRDFVLRLSSTPVVSIAKIRGRTRGIGNEFVLACDMRFASRQSALFGNPEVGVGLVPGGGALEWLPRLVGRSRALEIVLSGDDFDADIAERYGWVNRTLDDDDLDSFVDTLVRRLASFDRETLAAAKAQVNRFGTPTATELQSSNDLFFPLLALPGAQARRAKVRNIGYGVRSDFELNFGRYLPAFGRADDDDTARHVSEEIRYMSAIASTPTDAEAKNAPTSGRLFFLDLGAGRILSANPDGSDLKTIINEGRKLPDGLVLDVAAGHIYWTNMGDPKRNDGSIMRSDLNGKNMITIVPPGGTFTPKQLQLEKRSGKLYWSDREGMRVMRANLDGSEIETLVDTSLGDSRPGSDQRKWCVGIAVDTDGGKFYWTQKGGHDAGLGRIFRANIQVPQGQSAENRRDIVLLYDNLPEPIDLDLDPVNRTLYWTDRGDPPRGNTVNRAPMDPEAENGKEPEILFTHLMEGIGLALDLKGGRMFITDFGGSVYSANLDGSNRRTLLVAEGNLTGIAYAEVPSGYHEETNMEDNTPVQSSFSATIHAPIEKVDIPAWCFGLSESEYQSCSPGSRIRRGNHGAGRPTYVH